MLSILKNSKFTIQCHEIPCFVKMGTILDADQIPVDICTDMETKVEVTLRLIDVNRSRFIRTVQKMRLVLHQKICWVNGVCN